MEKISFCREILGNIDALDGLSGSDAGKVLQFLKMVEEDLSSLDEFPLIDLSAPPEGGYILYIIGDIHGDLDTARELLRLFYGIKEEMILKSPQWGVKFIFLGDYVDRAPDEVENGGFLTLLFLLCAKSVHPEEIFLLRGNHEAADLLPFSPYELPTELRDLFGEGPSQEIHDALLAIFSDLPLFLRTDNGLIASHAGFPRDGDISEISRDDREAILQTVWGDPEESNTYRGDISRSSRYRREDVEKFLEQNKADLLVRGHDYRTMGYEMYGGRLLTLHTSSRYKDKGAEGLQLVRAIVHDKKRIEGVKDIRFLHLENGKLRKASTKPFGEKSP